MSSLAFALPTEKYTLEFNDNSVKKHCTDLALILLHINLIPQHDEREVLRIMRARLDEELVSPAIERLEALRTVHVIHEHAAVCAAIEGDA